MAPDIDIAALAAQLMAAGVGGGGVHSGVSVGPGPLTRTADGRIEWVPDGTLGSTRLGMVMTRVEAGREVPYLAVDFTVQPNVALPDRWRDTVGEWLGIPPAARAEAIRVVAPTGGSAR